MKNRCLSEQCKLYGKGCFKINEEQRRNIFEMFQNLGNLQTQREFLIRHLEVRGTKRTTTNKTSRRKNTIKYKLTVNNEIVVVCKTLFLHTLGITEKSCRTAISKLNKMGILEPDKRGGRKRTKEILDKETKMREAIEYHINRYPRVESHYCRALSSREYLHPDLTLKKMYAMYCEELENDKKNDIIGSYSLFRKIFKQKNLSFFSPKKDQCSLCIAYREGSEDDKAKLKQKYNIHISEKTTAREKKAACKKEAMEDKTMLCGVFDLQQVIYLPRTNESAVFYKSRLSNFNLTFYNIATKECFCFIWHEAISGRGSSEIATCLYKVLEEYITNQSASRIVLFSDGCYAQNKNTVLPAMFLYTINKYPSLKEISIKYFETNHGQSEGDAAHSAISTAMSTAGNLYIPPQLHPIISLARRKQPYRVIPLNFNDFLDFKSFSKELRILTIRETDKGNNIKWTNIMEIMVTREYPTKIFFKNSHLENDYDSISLKRIKGCKISDYKLRPLNKEPTKIKIKKYQDLVALCTGQNPPVRHSEYQEYYKALPHYEQ